MIGVMMFLGFCLMGTRSCTEYMNQQTAASSGGSGTVIEKTIEDSDAQTPGLQPRYVLKLDGGKGIFEIDVSKSDYNSFDKGDFFPSAGAQRDSKADKGDLDRSDKKGSKESDTESSLVTGIVRDKSADGEGGYTLTLTTEEGEIDLPVTEEEYASAAVGERFTLEGGE